MNATNRLRAQALQKLVDSSVLLGADTREKGNETEFELVVPWEGGRAPHTYSGEQVDAFLVGVDAAQHAPTATTR